MGDLEKVDWGMVYERYWADNPDDPDRQRRKQAEFLVHGLCPWSVISEIGVLNQAAKDRVEGVLAAFPEGQQRPVLIRPGWYYY